MTTVVEKDWFGAVATDQAAQLIANTLAVTPEYFADVSCEGDRLFGLVTECKRESCNDTCETVLNGCARKNLWQYSYMAQQELEATLRWTLSPRYVTETLPWDGKSRMRLTFGGVVELNKVETVTSICDDIEYHPYVYSAVAIAVSGEDYTEIRIPMEYISFIEGIVLKNSNGDTRRYEQLDSGYPYVYVVGSQRFWAIPVAAELGVAGDQIDVLDCAWGYIEAPCSTTECEDGDIAAVYPNTAQKITIEKVIDGDRWLIRHRNMVRKEYQGDTIDLTKFQFHKLYDVVNYACFGETCELPVIRKKCTGTVTDCGCEDDSTPCDVVEADACATIIDAKTGVIELSEVELITDDNGDPVLDTEGCPTFRQLSDCTECLYEPYEITVHYRTNPVQSGISNTSAVETLKRAIAARVAAEVNLVDCGCNVECGFFKEMRKEMNTTVFTQGGNTVVALRYGNKQGQVIFAEVMSTAPRNRRVGLV